MTPTIRDPAGARLPAHDGAAAPAVPAGRIRARRRRLGRLIRWVTGGLVLLCMAAIAMCAGCLAALPDVDNAATLAAHIEAQHHVSASASIPRKLARAVIASEDSQFGDPVVINVLGGATRAGRAWIGGQSNPGGATIDQQLAKALFANGSGALAILRQIGLGIKLGLSFSHRQILTMYLNVNYYGNGFWGIEQAAKGYFGVPSGRLTWAEASMLAGLLQAPSAYDPLHHRTAAKVRQAYVLRRLVTDGVLSSEQARAAFRSPLPLGG